MTDVWICRDKINRFLVTARQWGVPLFRIILTNTSTKNTRLARVISLASTLLIMFKPSSFILLNVPSHSRRFLLTNQYPRVIEDERTVAGQQASERFQTKLTCTSNFNQIKFSPKTPAKLIFFSLCSFNFSNYFPTWFQEQRSLKAGNLSHQESNNLAASSMKLQSDSFSSEKVSNRLTLVLSSLYKALSHSWVS